MGFSMEKRLGEKNERLGDKNESLGDKNESLGEKNGNSHPLFYGSFMWECLFLCTLLSYVSIYSIDILIWNS